MNDHAVDATRPRRLTGVAGLGAPPRCPGAQLTRVGRAWPRESTCGWSAPVPPATPRRCSFARQAGTAALMVETADY